MSGAARERVQAALLTVARKILDSPTAEAVARPGVSVFVLVMVADNDDPEGMPLVGAARMVSGITIEQAADGLALACEIMSPTCEDCGEPLSKLHHSGEVH